MHPAPDQPGSTESPKPDQKEAVETRQEAAVCRDCGTAIGVEFDDIREQWLCATCYGRAEARIW